MLGKLGIKTRLGDSILTNERLVVKLVFHVVPDWLAPSVGVSSHAGWPACVHARPDPALAKFIVQVFPDAPPTLVGPDPRIVIAVSDVAPELIVHAALNVMRYDDPPFCVILTIVAVVALKGARHAKYRTSLI